MNLHASLQNVKGVGPKTAEALAAAGLKTVGDMIEFIPRTYEDYENADEAGKAYLIARYGDPF